MIGARFAETAAAAKRAVAEDPIFPAEIRAPAGTRAGVSTYRVRLASFPVHEVGPADILVAFNPSALVASLSTGEKPAIVIINSAKFSLTDLKKASLDSDPRDNGSLDGMRVVQIDFSKALTRALSNSTLSKKECGRCANSYVLGIALWICRLPLGPTIGWLHRKLSKRPELADAHVVALEAGHDLGDSGDLGLDRFEVGACPAAAGTYRFLNGTTALGLGLLSGARLAGLRILAAAAPNPGGRRILEVCAPWKSQGVMTFQAEDESAAACAAIGASYAGWLGVTITSGSGLGRKEDALSFAAAAELPLVTVVIQDAGPSSGMPGRTEQGGLLQAVLGRHGEAPLAVLACTIDANDCFATARQAVQLAIEHMIPVTLLVDIRTDKIRTPFKIPSRDQVEAWCFSTPIERTGEPFDRSEGTTRRWIKPGTPGGEHRLSAYEELDPSGLPDMGDENHARMVAVRAAKLTEISKSFPPTECDGGEANLVVLGWGATHGAIVDGLRILRQEGMQVAHIHLRYLNPLPTDLASILQRFTVVLVPELNSGHLARLILSELSHEGVLSFTKVQGRPFSGLEIADRVSRALSGDR